LVSLVNLAQGLVAFCGIDLIRSLWVLCGVDLIEALGSLPCRCPSDLEVFKENGFGILVFFRYRVCADIPDSPTGVLD
jgi:hypothetical protein